MPSFEPRDLLVGLLAVQYDLIRPDDLADALASWGQQRERPLAAVLDDCLPQDWRDQLAGTAQEQLERLASAIGPRESVSGSTVIVPPPPTRPVALPGDGATEAGCRYSRQELHARGGLGEVYRAWDRELGRTVALKEIQSRHAGLLDHRVRFIFEAEVTGRLEHPGVVPVYGLGRQGDGRPYYAMRFVEGQTLAQAIAEFHQAEGASRDPSARSVA
jgi:hypothetical protein